MALRVQRAISPSSSWTLVSGLVGRVISQHKFDCLIGATVVSKELWSFAWSTFIR